MGKGKMHAVDNKRLREGIIELLKLKVNEVLDNGGPFTLFSALENYRDTRQQAIKIGIDTSRYDCQIRKLEKQIVR